MINIKEIYGKPFFLVTVQLKNNHIDVYLFGNKNPAFTLVGGN